VKSSQLGLCHGGALLFMASVDAHSSHLFLRPPARRERSRELANYGESRKQAFVLGNLDACRHAASAVRSIPRLACMCECVYNGLA
jgi:hypothetical protein